MGIVFGGEAQISTKKVIIINPNSIKDQVLDELDRQIQSAINAIGEQINLPPLLKKPFSQVMNSLYQEILCRIPNPQFNSLIAQLPTSITIPLSCSEIRIGFSPFYKAILESADDLTGGATSDMRDCLRGNLNACKRVSQTHQISIEKIMLSTESNDVMYVKGLGYPNFANKTRSEIENEYKNTVKSLSQPSVESTPESVVVNGVSSSARISAEKEAGKSTGELIKWGKGDTNIPKVLIPYYNYIATKQFTRNVVIQALQERIQQERVKLARLQSAIKAYCDKTFNIKTIPPVRKGSITSLIGKVKQALKIAVNKTAEKLPLKKEILARLNANQPVVRGCCCPIPQIESAKDSVNAHIETAKREIESTIDRVGNMIADVISQEEYRTRQQINADSQAIADTLKQMMCLRSQLEFQRNKLQLLQLEVEVAKLQVLYSLLNKEEMKEYKEKLKQLRKQY